MKSYDRDIPVELLKIAGILGIRKKDIINMQRSIPNNKTPSVKLAIMGNYNNSVGFYGTISILNI